MRIYILDAEHSFAEALAARLSRFFPHCSFQSFTSPGDFLQESAQYKESGLLLYCPEHFPEFTPSCCSLKLHDALPLRDAGEEDGGPKENQLLRLGSLRKMREALEKKLTALEPERSQLNPLSTFCLPFPAPEAERLLLEKIRENQESGSRSLVLELGPSYLFPDPADAPESVPGDRFLLAVSLQRAQVCDVGRFWEPWPHYRAALRFTPPAHCDDWLFISQDTFRKSLGLICSWARQEYAADWRLFLLCRAFPQKLCETAASLSDYFYFPFTADVAGGRAWQLLGEKLTALLPSGAGVYKDAAAVPAQEELSQSLPPLYDFSAVFPLGSKAWSSAAEERSRE